ncbi:MAG: beta-ketoacyl-[acyl-carrier-protein] synthase II, partial [Bacteroidetes bacterium]
MELKRVVVTGIGAITPIGNNVNDLWDALVNGVSGTARITLFDTEKFKTKIACEVKNYDGREFFDRKELRKHDRYA